MDDLRRRHTVDPRTCVPSPTKTERSRRTIHLAAITANALREQRQRTGRWGDSGSAFATLRGRPMDFRRVVCLDHEARVRAGLPDLPWHHLRHFAATSLLAEGDDLFVVSRILGHSSVSTTAAFYGHVRPSMLQASADRMDELMRRAARS